MSRTIHVTAAVEIDRPAAEVFALLSDVTRNPEWQGGMVDCRWTSEPPVAVGSTYEQEARFLGKRISTSFVVTALDPGRSVSIETTSGTMTIRVTRTVEPLDDGRCSVSADVSGEPTGLQRFIPGMRGMVQRSVRGDYARLKARLEAESTQEPV